MNVASFAVRRPEEGWLPLILLLVIALTLAFAVDDPAWVNGRSQLTDCLPLMRAARASRSASSVPRLGWGRWTTHAIGAVFAGLLIPILAGWAAHPGMSAERRSAPPRSGTVNAYLDLAWYRRQFTTRRSTTSWSSA